MYNLIIEEYIFSLGALISLPLRRNIFLKKSVVSFISENNVSIHRKIYCFMRPMGLNGRLSVNLSRRLMFADKPHFVSESYEIWCTRYYMLFLDLHA